MTTVASRDRRRTVAALAALTLLQVLHDADTLRTDATASVVGLATDPAVFIGVGGALLALVAVHRRRRWGRVLALSVAAVVAIGFVLSHGIPFLTSFTVPYWGEGSADPLQWTGFLAILGCCIAIWAFALLDDTATDSAPSGLPASTEPR
jgi:peptidoglycan/LPS O-acetylase OafA/YrhL